MKDLTLNLGLVAGLLAMTALGLALGETQLTAAQYLQGLSDPASGAGTDSHRT